MRTTGIDRNRAFCVMRECCLSHHGAMTFPIHTARRESVNPPSSACFKGISVKRISFKARLSMLTAARPDLCDKSGVSANGWRGCDSACTCIAITKHSECPPPVRRKALRRVVRGRGGLSRPAWPQGVDVAATVSSGFCRQGRVALIGWGHQPDALHAALINSLVSSIYSVDGAHASVIVYPGRRGHWR
jgi:hypothetical protein